MNFENNLNENINILETAFDGCGDVVKRKIPVGTENSRFIYVIYIDGLVNRDYIERQLMTNVVLTVKMFPPEIHFKEVFDAVAASVATTADVSETKSAEDAQTHIMSGDCVFLIDGSDTAVVLSAKGWPNRGVSTPDTEMSLKGAKEAFTESLRMNTALMRRRIRDTNLKIKQIQVGKRSKTDVAVVYLQDVVRQNILDGVLSKIGAINIDAVLESGYIEQYLEESKLSPFPQTQVTERPDKASAAVYEGRIAIIVDNSPFVILVPVTLNTFFQAAEDYYQRFEIMSLMRILRYISAFIAVSLPSLYIAFTVYHPSMLPAPLVLKMAGARQSVPFSAAAEVAAMELAFELLREAGVRLPGPIGGTLGIVGGLIMGQAAVEAGLVSPIVVIIAALSGIASFAVPNQEFTAGLRMIKFYLIASGAVLGLFGVWAATLTVFIHLAALKSFGIPYMYPIGCSNADNGGDLKDSIIRAPITKMVMRPIFANDNQKRRMGE